MEQERTLPQVTGIYRNRSNITLTSPFPPSSPADSIESSDSLRSSVDMESDTQTKSSIENDITIQIDPSLLLPVSPLLLALQEVEALYKPRARIIAPADHTTKEKMRRERIKDSCAQLRILLPYIRGRKTDMASILETCVDYLRIVNGLLPREAIQKVTDILGRETANLPELGNHTQCHPTITTTPPPPTCASYLSSPMESSPCGLLVTPPATPESPFFDWTLRQCDTPVSDREQSIEGFEHCLRPPEPVGVRTPYAKRLHSEQALTADLSKMRRLSDPDRLTPGVYTNPIGQTPAACQFLVFDDIKPADYMGFNSIQNTSFHDEYLQLPMLPDVRFLHRPGANGSIAGTATPTGPLYSSSSLGRTATTTTGLTGSAMEDGRRVMFVCPDSNAGADMLPLAQTYTPVHMYGGTYPKTDPAMIPIGNPDIAYLPSIQQPLQATVKHDYDSHPDLTDPLQACFSATYPASSDYPPDPEKHYVNPNAVLPLCQPSVYRVSLQSTTHTSLTTATSTRTTHSSTTTATTTITTTAAIKSQMSSSTKPNPHASNQTHG